LKHTGTAGRRQALGRRNSHSVILALIADLGYPQNPHFLLPSHGLAASSIHAGAAALGAIQNSAGFLCRIAQKIKKISIKWLSRFAGLLAL
jgi:hypothetical protein